MSVLAFTHDDYDDVGISSNCRGVWNDDREVREFLRGGRYEKTNLEILDLDTMGFSKYRWHSMYEYRSECLANPLPRAEWDSKWCSTITKHFLTLRYVEPKEEFEISYNEVQGKYDDPRYYEGWWDWHLED